VLPTNLLPGTHLARKEQNNDEYGYSQFLDYLERSVTIEVIVCASFCWPHQSFLLSQYITNVCHCQKVNNITSEGYRIAGREENVKHKKRIVGTMTK
jgi:hypothetical protein